MRHSAIDALDRALTKYGTPVTVRRRVGNTDVWVTVACRAVIRGYHPSELVGSVAQTDKKVILSPTPFDQAAGWPGSAGGPRYPRKGDQILIDGRPCTIQGSDPMMIGLSVVRIETQIRG